MQRIEMNTKSLQKHFPDVYRDFFANNDLVVSGGFKFPWGYEGVGTNSKDYLRIKSLLSLKCYVGIKIRKDKKIVFNNVSFFDIVGKKFEKVEYAKISKGEEDKIIDLIKKELENLGFDNGIEIEILSETTRGHSFGFSGTSSAIISYGIYKISEFFVDKKLINKEEFLENNFKKIFSLAGKMDYILRYGASFGHNSMFTLKASKGVSYFLSEKLDLNIDSLDKIGDLPFEFQKINNDGNIDLPFDYFIIFSGLPTDTKQVEYYKKLEYEEDDISEFINEKLSNKNYYLDKFKNKEAINLAKFDILSIENIKTLNYFYKIYKKPHDENLISNFIEHINNRRAAISLVEKQSSFADDFDFFFRKNKVNENEKIGISPAYSGKLGGGYIAVTKPGISRTTIEKTLEDIKNIYPNAEIEYSSYLDGETGDGVMVEQFISEGVYSQYVDKNKFLFKSNKGDNYIGDYNEIIEKEKDGLLFDMINNKIYLNGEKLTSKDIPSQNTTIEVITRLLEHIGEEISNKELPASSYSTNKNEMLGKIILPLIKLIEEKTKEQIPLVCKGSLNDFYIKMGNINIKIGVIKRI